MSKIKNVVVLLVILAIYFAEILGLNSKDISSLKKEILELPKKIEKTLELSSDIKDFSKKVYQEKDIFFLGRGIDEAVAKEGSLKLKEISYIHSESYAAGELKHGSIALIENDVTVVGIMTDPKLVEKTVSNIQEIITRGAKTLVVTNQNIDTSKKVLTLEFKNLKYTNNLKKEVVLNGTLTIPYKILE